MASVFDFKAQGSSGISLLVLGLIAWGAYIVCLGAYRLYLSPLANFPGPKLAALTTWYQGYYDIWLRGKYVWRIKEMHAKYGPIIRINPHEIHINDPYFLDEVYAGTTKKRDKYRFTGRQMAQTKSLIVSISHDLHRKRRAAMSPYFSKTVIRKLEPIILDHLATLLDRFESARKSGEVLELGIVYRALTSDIITQYSFGKSTDYLDLPDFNAPFYRSVMSVFECVPLLHHVSWLGPLMNSLPTEVVLKLMPALGSVHVLQKQWKRQIEDIMKSDDLKTRNDTIFHGLLNSNLPPLEKSIDRMLQEAQLLVVAGQDTTGLTLACLTFNLLANPSCLANLKTELAHAMPDPDSLPTCAIVENLPYLSAVIQETLRLYPPATMRGQRVSPDEPVVYRSQDGVVEWSIPPGTPMSMSAYLIQMDPEIFENPNEWRPERWIENPKLDRYLLAFSRGSRMCLGINLAYQELHLVTAGIFRKFVLYDPQRNPSREPAMALYDTIRERDVDMTADLAMPAPQLGSKGVRITVH